MQPNTVSRRGFIRSSALGAGALSAGVGLAPEARGAADRKRPNFVYIMSDQQHWQALGCVDPFFDTPSQDQFADDAALFERAFCTTPQCSPSRSSMLTGLYPSKTRVMGNIGAAGGDNLGVKTIGSMLGEAGYYTGYFGKWHLGNDPLGNAGWNEDARKQRDPGTTDKAIEFLASDRAKTGPFGLVVSYTDPHDVYHFNPEKDKAPDDVVLSQSWHRETFKNKPPVQKEFMTRDQGTKIWKYPQEVWEAYHDFYRRKVRLYDDQVGRVLAAIKESGQWENTIVIIGSDHGDMDTNHRLIFKGPFMYEHMVRVPLMVRVPKTFGGGLRGRIADYDTVNVDLVPTIREFAGLAPIRTDGISLKPVLLGEKNPPQRDYVIGQYHSKQQWVNPIRMIRTARFKYNRYIDHGDELYDLVDDPEEIVNLADDPGRARIKQELVGELNQWIRENDDPFYSLSTTELKKGYQWPKDRSRKTGKKT